MKPTEKIESEIERTRSEMTGTLQALERRLSPNRLVDEAMASMRNINLSDSHMMDLVRDNPIPLGLVGLGIGWLVVSSLRAPPAGAETADYAEETYTGRLARGVRAAEEWAGYGAGGDGAAQRAAEAAATTRERVGHMAGAVTDTAQEWSRAAQSGAREVSRRMGDWTRSVGRQAGDFAGRTGDVFESNPMTVGLLALAAGIALGAALPKSRREAELWGSTATDILDSARESGRQALQRAGRVAQRAAQAVAEGGPQTASGAEGAKPEVGRRGGTAKAH
jgi:ElaB/YqjD/DUF883 family membrane-anchored ribosome-binding protein